MKKALRAVRWTLLNGALVALAWYGYAGDIRPARNVFIFFTVLSFLASFGSYSEKVKTELHEKGGPSVPLSVAIAYDISLAGFLVWHGAWAMAVLLIVGGANQAQLWPQKETINA